MEALLAVAAIGYIGGSCVLTQRQKARSGDGYDGLGGLRVARDGTSARPEPLAEQRAGYTALRDEDSAASAPQVATLSHEEKLDVLREASPGRSSSELAAARAKTAATHML